MEEEKKKDPPLSSYLIFFLLLLLLPPYHSTTLVCVLYLPTINNKKFTDYFPTATLQYKVQQPFILTNTKDNYDLKVTVKGGGSNGQAEAVRLAISRALCKINDEFRSELKPEGLLTRDPRMVERKKFGQKKARKKFQFSKR